MSNVQRQIYKLQEQIRSLEKLRGVLDSDIIQKKEAELQARLHTIIETAGGAYVEGDVSIQNGDFVGRDKVLAILADQSVIVGGDARGLNVITGSGNRITISPDQVSLDTLLRAYFRSLAAECSILPLGVVDPHFARPNHEGEVLLPDVYTDLDVTSPPSREKETRRAWSLRLARGEGETRFPLLQAITAPEVFRLVLLGDAGSGKTTFVNYLTYRLAKAFLDQEVEFLPPMLRGQLVVRLVLRSAAAQLPIDATRGNAQMLWEVLESDLTNRMGEPAAKKLFPHLQQRLWHDGGIILLDGLDEVPEAGRRRKCLLEAIQELTGSLPQGSRVLLTARPYAYADPAWHLPNFQVLALTHFNQQQIERFVEHWHKAVCHIMGWDIATAQERAESLTQTVQARPYLSDLASRPLLLTLIATLHTSWGHLPEDRAGLYEESVRLLLSRWERGRQVLSPDGNLFAEPNIAKVLGIGEERLRTLLEKLSYQTHTRQGSERERDDAPADISLGEVLTVFTPLLPDNFNPWLLLNYLESRSGLLVSRREEIFTFPHRSFQEYLAACHLTNDPDFGSQLRNLVWNDPEWWREVCLLAVGKACQGGMAGAVSILNILLPESLQDVTDIQENCWHLAILVGQALVELRLDERTMGQPHYRAIQKRTTEWLTTLIERGYLSPRDRLMAGDALGRLDDPRLGVGFTVGVNNQQALPDITWKEIPAGVFIMGSPEDDEQAYDDERPAHTIELPTFHISRYPITNDQYRPFLESGGYEDPKYWTKEGWAWRRGIDPHCFGNEVTYDEERKKQYMKWTSRRTIERRNRPYWWHDPQWNVPNRPVVGINWYEAVAYCKWLDEQLRSIDFSLLRDRYVVRLPTEAEWEKAARGPHAFRWPWGNEWQDGMANTSEVGLGQTSTVGMFPDGASPYGLLDMAGNVYEWVTTRLGQIGVVEPKYRYPYNAEDGREDLDVDDIRLVKGGAWNFDKSCVRCSGRDWDYPVIFDQNTGFRVVISLPLSS